MNSMRRTWRQFKQQAAVRLATYCHRRFGPREPSAFGILTYHRVAPRISGSPPPTYNVTPEGFRQQMRGLLAAGYEPWSLRQAIGTLAAGGSVPRRAFVVTFDDGYRGLYYHVWPTLRELNIPATIFLATGYLDREAPFPFDDWTAAGSYDVPPASWKPLTTWQCAEMFAGGLVDLGAHTHTHADFRERDDDFRADLDRSLDVLRQRFGIERPTFSFPFGHVTPQLIDQARAAGVQCSLTTQQQLVRHGSDPHRWGRFGAMEFDTPETLAAKLDGWYSWARDLWRSARQLRRD